MKRWDCMHVLILAIILAGCRTYVPTEDTERVFEARALSSVSATPRYTLDCEIVRIVDGDTAVIRQKVWFDITVEGSCRLLDFDAPEMVGADRTEGLRWKAMLEWLAPPGSKARVKSYALDKYGRPLVVIERGGININQALVDAMAVPVPQ